MKKEFRRIGDAKKFVQSLGLKSRTEWNVYYKSGKKPDDIPTNPRRSYGDDWIGWGEFLGTGNISVNKRQFNSFKNTKKFVQELGFNGTKEWKEYCKSGKKPDDMPTNPRRSYGDDWIGWGEFLGTGNIAPKDMQFRSYDSAKRFVQSLGLKSRTEWNVYYKSGKKPDDIPTNPSSSYKKEWKSWGDFLGTGNIANNYGDYRSFNSAKKFVQSLKLKTQREWELYCKSGKKPKNIPIHSNSSYKKEWKSWGDFLGTGNIAPKDMQFRSYDSAKKFVQSLGLKNLREWGTYHKSSRRPSNIPSNPRKIYKKEWKSWGDFLGTGNIANIEISEETLPWKIAKPLYQKIKIENNLKNLEDWKKYIKKHKLPKGLPKDPTRTYSKQVVMKKKKERQLRYDQNLNP